MIDSTYPQSPKEWQSAIHYGIHADAIEGQEAYQAGQFPYEKLALWMREAYGEGFSPDFVPALLRNIKGLVAWVYGEGAEPSWPGSDFDVEDQAPG